ncbi:unannotated protein [freshwater metagenome]|uniref:GDP-mannose 4,6-dehydratase n=1 Tax=freshwater metagenome TaxID=449393 RepID=A0A6J7WAN6_9ZZZZ
MRALITGISGQDGRYLAPLLQSLNYEVHGLSRDTISDREVLLDLSGVILHKVDTADYSQIRSHIDHIQPNLLFNLAGISSVNQSFGLFNETISANFLFLEKILRSILELGLKDFTRIYQASSSEMFGRTSTVPQTEKSPFNPLSPYGLSKLASHHLCSQYREREGMFISSGILYNHESPKRSEIFVTRKITKAVAGIRLGLTKELILGNVSAQRDWGFAGDYVAAMVAMLLHETPQDFIVATGLSHSVLEFVKEAFKAVGMEGAEVHFLKSSSEFVRKQDHTNLVGDSTKAREILDWEPKKTFQMLIQEMVEIDMLRLSSHRI